MNERRIIIPSDGKISTIGLNTQFEIPTLGIPLYPDVFLFYALCLHARHDPELLQKEAYERLEAIVQGLPRVFKKFGYSSKDFLQFYKEKEEEIDEGKKSVQETEKERRGDEEKETQRRAK